MVCLLVLVYPLIKQGRKIFQIKIQNNEGCLMSALRTKNIQVFFISLDLPSLGEG